MKTLREYLDQLDEIDRRGFLKGMGAAAVAGAAGGAKAQVGGGENESEWAAKRATDVWARYVRDNQTATEWLYKTIQRRAMQFYHQGGNRDFQGGTNAALQDAINAVDPFFQQVYKILEKDKESGSVGKAIIGGILGLNSLSKEEGRKLTGSMHRVNVATTAQEFVQVYTDSLNKTLQSAQQQKQQPQAEIAPIFKPENANLNIALSIYYYAKESNQPIASEMLKGITEYINATNQKDFVNTAYQDIKKAADNYKSTNPKQNEDLKNQMLAYYKTSLQQLKQMSNSAGLEFKESVAEQELEEASPDAVKRIEQLVRYK